MAYLMSEQVGGVAGGLSAPRSPDASTSAGEYEDAERIQASSVGIPPQFLAAE